MIFTPRITPEVLSQLLARVMASNEAGLTDVSEGGVLATILGSVAQEFSNMDFRITALSQNFFLNLAGADLDRRIAELPSSFARRLPASAASGGNFRLTRSSDTPEIAAELVIPARELVVQASSNPTVTYTNVNIITFPAGEAETEGHNFVASTAGTIGNLRSPLAVDTIITNVRTLLTCTNVDALGGGQEREPDSVLRFRAQQWVASLALSQNRAMEVLARSFRDSNGSGLTHARMWNDPDMRGYSELVVDNGTAMEGMSTLTAARTVTLPNLQGDGNRYVIYFQAPAVTTPVFLVNGVELAPAYVHVIHEQGVAWLREDAPVSPGDVITISSYQRFTGTIAELQTVLNETAIAAGTRVRVVPPTRQPITISGDMTVTTGSNLLQLRQQVKLAIQEFMRALPPGEPLFMYKLIGYLNLIPGVLNIVFDQTDVYPGSTRSKLVAPLETISLR